jgi:UDP-2,3-diacylglucosamine pyrophosphatase LpxH
MVSHLIGVDFVNEYLVESGHKKMLVLHGDIFDNFISKYPMFTKFADKIYRLIQRYDRFYNNQCDFVICGHTHAVLTKASDMVEYYNCGCWTESVCSFITINSGNVETKYERPI